MRIERTESPDFQTGFDSPQRGGGGTPNIEHYMNPKTGQEETYNGKVQESTTGVATTTAKDQTTN